jgi:hypothetical protein
MSRTVFPLVVSDISVLARSLKQQLAASEAAPGHVELLNIIARSAGYRNFQHFRAQFDARDALENSPLLAAPAPEPEPVDYVRLKRVVRYFDAQGRLSRWPSKAGQREPCLWVIWSRLPSAMVFGEREIDRLLQANHLFGDHCLLRRELFERGLVSRTPDGREYRRIERKPPPDALELIRHLKAIASRAA